MRLRWTMLDTDTVSGHFISRCMILFFFFFSGLCRLAFFILYGTGYGYARCAIVFAFSWLVVSIACCNEVMIHGHMGDVMSLFLRFLFMIHIDLYLFYLSYPS